VSALGPVPFDEVFAPASNDSSQDDEEDSDEALVQVELASELSGIVVAVVSDIGVNDGRVDPVEVLLGRALLDRSKAANAAASLGVDVPSSFKTESEWPSAGTVRVDVSGCVCVDAGALVVGVGVEVGDRGGGC